MKIGNVHGKLKIHSDIPGESSFLSDVQLLSDLASERYMTKQIFTSGANFEMIAVDLGKFASFF